MRLLFCAAAVFYFSSTVFAAEPTQLSPMGERATDRLSSQLGMSLKLEEKESLALSEKAALQSKVELTSDATDEKLVRTVLYCVKAGISVGFQFDGGECVTSSGERKSFGMIALGGLEAQAQTAVIVVYSAKGETINGLYGKAKGLSLGLLGAGSKVRFTNKRKIREPNIRLAGRATLYSFGVGLGYTVQNGGEMWIDDAETAP